MQITANEAHWCRLETRNVSGCNNFGVVSYKYLHYFQCGQYFAQQKNRNSHSRMEQQNFEKGEYDKVYLSQRVWNGHVTFTWRSYKCANQTWIFSVIRKLPLPWNGYLIDTLIYWNSPWQCLQTTAPMQNHMGFCLWAGTAVLEMKWKTDKINSTNNKGARSLAQSFAQQILFQSHPFSVINCRANDCRANKPDPITK